MYLWMGVSGKSVSVWVSIDEVRGRRKLATEASEEASEIVEPGKSGDLRELAKACLDSLKNES